MAPVYQTGQTPVSTAVGDCNGDGNPDVAVANYTSNSLTVLLGNGDGTFRHGEQYLVGSGPGGIATADLNNDRRLDLVVTDGNSNSVAIFLGYGDGTFAAKATYSAGSYPGMVAIGDLNGDGEPDLAVTDFYSHRAGNWGSAWQRRRHFRQSGLLRDQPARQSHLGCARRF